MSVKNIIKFLFSIFFILLFGCKIKYSFTGASVSPEVRTISIQYFSNNAPIVLPSLSQTFTEKLKDKFLSQANLGLVANNGDLSLSGAITGYSTQPIAIQGNETAALNRLTIIISVKFVNSKNEKQDFETTFSRYADYDSKLSLSQVEDDLIKQINDQLVDDIFNKAMINW